MRERKLTANLILRLTEQDKELLERTARQIDLSVSETTRRAIRLGAMALKSLSPPGAGHRTGRVAETG